MTMRSVSIIGIGSTPFGILEGQSLKRIATIAANEAILNAGIDRNDIQASYLGNFASGPLAGQEALAPQIAHNLGLRKEVPSTKVEGACCGGGIALRHAYLLIAAGIYDFALVVGVEKMTHASTAKNTEALALALDHETEGKIGLTFPGFFALVARRHMHEYGTKEEHLALVSVKNHGNSVTNPRARFRDRVSLEKVMNSRVIADPLKLYDCCPISDGAAAAVLCPTRLAIKFTDKPVEIIGSAQTSGHSSYYEAPDPTAFVATVTAAQQAYKMAGIRADEVNVAELHDCFTIAEIVDSEDLGFFRKGFGGFAVAEGQTEVGGKVAINPSGGLISKGHPVGATGIGQVVEIVKQLRGEHENQVPDASIGLTHNLGATAQICTVHVFRRL